LPHSTFPRRRVVNLKNWLKATRTRVAEAALAENARLHRRDATGQELAVDLRRGPPRGGKLRLTAGVAAPTTARRQSRAVQPWPPVLPG